MCGISGVFLTRNPSDADSLDAVPSMMHLTTRRGPDDDGLWRNDRCALGFRRLSILDLSKHGHQPMCTEDGRYALVYNGELYNYGELRKELQQRGRSFRSSGDTEVVLYALATYGTEALNRFNGMFALAFYDAVEHRLLLARDHAGIKPLYYLPTSDGVVFGSQLDQLIQHPWGRRQSLSETATGLYLRFGYVPAPYSMIEGVRQLDGGCWAEIDAGGSQKVYRYWDFPKSTDTLHGARLDEVMDSTLESAVKRQLVSDVPLGVFLSGGIDSPLVAAESSRHASGTIDAFSISVPGWEGDEGEDARRYADEIGLRQFICPATGDAALELVDDVLSACTEPMADFSIFPTLLVSRLARSHVKVALSGDGGDELFWGYPHRFGAAIDQARYYRLPRWARFGFIGARKTFGIGTATRDALWGDVGRMYQKKHTVLPDSDLHNIFPSLPALPDEMKLFDFAETSPDAVAQWVRYNEFRLHLAKILLKVDRASMFHSLEVRVPLLDKEMIALAARVPWQECLDLRRRTGKLPLRRALRRRVRHQTKAKKGFTVPMYEWLKGPLQPLVQSEILNRGDLLGLEVDIDRITELYARLLAGERHLAMGMWMLLSLVLWRRRHYGQRT